MKQQIQIAGLEDLDRAAGEFLKAIGAYCLDIRIGASVKNGNLYALYLYCCVINAKAEQSGKNMLYGLDRKTVLTQRRAAGG